MRVGFLAHYQPLNSRPSTFLSKDVAELLVKRLAAERISQKLIRAVPPESVFLPIHPEHNPASPSIGVGLTAPIELPGLRFIQPASASARNMTLIRWHWDHSHQEFQFLASKAFWLPEKQPGALQ
jgi:hypothetical protein